MSLKPQKKVLLTLPGCRSLNSDTEMLKAPGKHLVAPCLLNLQLYIRLHLAIHGMLLTRHPAVVLGLLITDDVLLQISIRTSRLHLQLDGATPFHQSKNESSLVDRVTHAQQAMVHQNSALIVLSQCLRDPLSFLVGKDDTAIRRVDGVAIMQAAHVLRDHLQRLGENTPCPSCLGVRMAYSMNIRTTLVDLGVDEVSGPVSRDGSGPGVWSSADDAAGRDFHGDHVAGCEGAVVARERVHPHDLGEFRVADRDVAGLTFCVAHAGPIPEDGGHVDKNMPPLGRKGWERGYV